MSIREEVERSWDSANTTLVNLLHGIPGRPQDVRYQWPLQIFERVCSCDEGWGSYDCSQCDFGFIANEAKECVKRSTNQLSIRRNIRHLSKQERVDLISLLEAAKNEEEKEWAAITSMPEEPNGHYILQNVSTYDLMAFTHLFSAREKDNPYCLPILLPNDTATKHIILFAHDGSSFLPWHRYFLLRYESELRRTGERLGINSFSLPYWDWTPTSNCLIFTHDLFGTPEYNDEVANVSGTLFEKGKWPVVCDLMYRYNRCCREKEQVTESAAKCLEIKTLCDIEGDRMANRTLQRGAWEDRLRNLKVPDYKSIAMTLTPDQVEGIYGFSNRLEGHLEQCSGEAEKCMYYIGGANELNMHGIVHDFVGGHMSVGGPSANDPVFFHHHANVDRIFERWLQKYNGTPPSYHPLNGGPPGHNLNDYLVPLFPLRKVADFYKDSKELGYVYDDLPWSIPTTDYQLGCPSAECDKGGYPATVLTKSTSAYCTRIRKDQELTAGS